MKFRIKKILIIAFLFSTVQCSFAESTPKLAVKINEQDGSYEILNQNSSIVHAQVAAKINDHWVRSSDYPKHIIQKTVADKTIITHTGLKNQPDLECTLQTNSADNSGNIFLQVKNTSGKTINVQAIRLLDANKFDFGTHLRVLSDSYSEDRPTLKIYDLNKVPNNLHRAVGSQLFYNLDNKNSLFFATLTSNKFLTIMRLHLPTHHYEIDSLGTTEINKEFCLKKSPLKDQIELSLLVAPGKSLSSEHVMFSLSNDYHKQLETYGNLIREKFHARVSTPNPMGWWSWTAYYMDLNQEQAAKDAVWLSEHLKQLGYHFFHLDEGYQKARGDYLIAHGTHFPDGLQAFGNKVHDLGLTMGVWTAPFEVSNRSNVFKKHKDWLVSNALGEPIPLIKEDGSNTEKLYVLDATHPGVQNFLRETYQTMANKWGVRYIKLDFMEDSAIEGYHYRPNTTALEAQRIGLKIIREAVGNDVLLDKDGSPMLNLVGLVDTGRVSVDTGHQFAKTKDSAFGIAARYYMHRNFFVNDPDAFSVTEYRKDTTDPLTLDEAKASIALAGISGGMFEIGDNLQLLKDQPDRLKLLENPELIKMVGAGQVSIPMDLMNYLPGDEQPSIFYLQQNSHQAILSVFNWTEHTRKHSFDVAQFGFPPHVKLVDILDDGKNIKHENGKFDLEQPAHSVKMIKIVV